jgi:ATP synthase protein I
MDPIDRSTPRGVVQVDQPLQGDLPQSQRDALSDSLWPEQEPEPPVRPLTRIEAQALVARHPLVSAWRVIAVQALVGVLVALVWWVLSRSPTAAVSALYGAAVAVVPNVLMARGVFGPRGGRSVGGLVMWEFIKIVVAGAMLAMAHVWIRPLSWAAMLVTMVLCMKVIGVTLLWQGRRKKF